MSLSLSLLSSVFFCVGISPYFSPLDGLERSKTVHGGLCTVSMEVYALYPWRSIITTVCVSDGLERSHLWVVIFSWALALACCCSLYGANGDVSASRAESPHVSPWSMSRGWMKAGSDWCLFLPSGEESSELGSTDDSLDGNDAGGEYEGDLGEWHLGGDDAGGEHDGDVGGV